MAITAETMRRLSQIDMSGEALREVLAIMADMTSGDDSRRAKDRERKRHVRGMSAEIPETFQETSEEQSTPSLPQRDNQTPTQPRKSKIRADDAKSILGSVLAEETVSDLVAHRKALKAPLTVGAAKGLVKNFVAYGNPEEAARAMMSRGWKGFEIEWMNRPQARAGPIACVPKTNSYFDGLTGRKPYDDPNDLQHGGGAGRFEQSADDPFGRKPGGPVTLEAVRPAGRGENLFDIEGLSAFTGSARRFG